MRCNGGPRSPVIPSLGDSARPLPVSGFRRHQSRWEARCFRVNPPGKPTNPSFSRPPFAEQAL